MKVAAGKVTDEQREIIARSNREGLIILIASMSGNVIEDSRGQTGERGPEQFVGTVTTYTHDHVFLGGWSFSTQIPWKDIRGVWLRDDAPRTKVVQDEYLVA